MDHQGLIFSIIGGLGLFIFGIKIMSDGLKKASGQKMRQFISYLTKNRFSGLLLGTVVTSIIQSSSATTVMVVGFANAGLMTLIQAIPVILGANIGTTITAQLVAFKLTDYALPIVAIGVFFNIFGRKKRTTQIGEAILGFGILFLGLSIMSSPLKGLGEGSTVQFLFAKFSYNIFLGLIVGTIITAIVQSSSVTTGIIVVMASMGLIDIRGAIPLVFGANIGTCITAIIASIGTNLTAKRAAVAHVIQKTVGAIIALSMFSFYLFFIPLTSQNVGRQVANSHTLFNIITSLLFISFVPLYTKFIKKILPGEAPVIEGPQHLVKNLLTTPVIALDAAKKETLRMMYFVKEMVETSMSTFKTRNRKDIEKVLRREELVDELRDAIAVYLGRITEQELSETEAKMIPSMFHTINDIERIGDHAENMVVLAQRKLDKKINIPDYEIAELDKMYKIVKEMMEKTIIALSDHNKKETVQILRKERQLNRMFIQLRELHIERINHRKCDSYASIIFTDMLNNFEKIGDHITNIAQAMEGKFEWNHDDIY